MNDIEFESYLIKYVEDSFQETRRKSSKVIINWLWNDYIFDVSKRFMIIKNFKDFLEFEKVPEKKFTFMGIIGKRLYEKLQLQMGKHFIINFNITKFLNILRLSVKVPEKIIAFFSDYSFFSSFILNLTMKGAKINNYYEFFFKLNYEELFYSNYEVSKHFKNISKVFFLLVDLRPSINDQLKSFLNEYIKKILYDNNLKNFEEIFIEVVNNELIDEFFIVLMFFINLMEMNEERNKIFESFEEKIECEEFNQLIFFQGKSNELLKIAENFYLFISNTKNLKIMNLVERIFEILKNSKNIELDETFQNKFSIERYGHYIRNLMELNGNQIDEISKKIVISNYHLQYEYLYTFLIISNELYKKINSNNNFSENDILKLFGNINDFEENYSKLVSINLSKIIESNSDLLRFYNSIEGKVNEFFEKIKHNIYFDKDLFFHKFDNIKTKNITICILEFNDFNYRYFNLIRNYLKYKYPFVEEKIGIFSESIGLNILDFIQIKINKDNYLFKFQEFNNFSNQNFILSFNKNLSFELFKYNLLEPLFNKLLESFSTLNILIYNKESHDCYYYLIYSLEKKREFKIYNLRIKDHTPKKIYINKLEYLNIVIKNPNKWPISISEIKILFKNQEFDILKDIYLSSFEDFNINTKVSYIDPGSYSILLLLKYNIMEGNKIIYEKIQKLSIPLVVEETPLQVQKKRKQDDFFNKYV